MTEILLKLVYDGDGKYLGQYLLSDVPEPPPSNGGEQIPYSEGIATVILKNAGSLSHPAGYQCDAEYTKIGRRVFLDIRLYMLSTWDSGSGGDEFWLDVDGPAEILPDFDGASLESAGVFHAWGGRILEGNAYWSRNVGSGLDGIRVTNNEQHVSRSHPKVWANGDHWRITIDYNV